MEKILLQLTFLLLIFILYRRGLNNFIFFPLLYYVVSSLPLFYYTFGDIGWDFFTNHLLINNVIILFSFIFANLLPKFFGTVLIFPSLISISKKIISLKFLYTLLIGLFCFELFLIYFYNKPSFINSLISFSLLEDRVRPFNTFYIIDILISNYYGFLLTFIIFFFGLILTKDKTNFIQFVILLLLIIMYLGMLKKSAIVMLIIAFLMIYYNLYKKFPSLKLKYIFFFGFFGLIFHFVLISYYGYKDHIYIELLKRIFIEPIISTKKFYVIFNGIDPSLKYLPSEGAFIFNIKKITLEMELFYHLRPNMMDRYGNNPVLSLTYGIIAIGNSTYFYMFFLYTLFFASGNYFEEYLKSNILRKRVLVISLSLYYMPIFLSGAFKVFSIFIIYPISLIFIFFAYKLLPENITIK